MSAYSSFAVAGATGIVGKALLAALEESGYGHQVTILTRKSGEHTTLTKEWENKGVRVAPVDYGVEEDLVTALAGVDVFISTLGQAGTSTTIPLQIPLLKAAKKARVKLFVASHWGSPVDGSEHPALAPLKFRDAPLRVAEEIDLPWARFRTGGFPELALSMPPLGMTEFKDRKATFWSDGNAQISWTTLPDIARYVVYVLTHLSPSELNNRTFNIEGASNSPNEIAYLYETKYPGTPIAIQYKPLSELEERAAKGEGPVAIFYALILALVTGKGKHDESTLDNGLFPDWKPKGFVDIL